MEYKMNDEEVHPVNVQTVLSQCAYMLFYRQIGGKKQKNGDSHAFASKSVKNREMKVKNIDSAERKEIRPSANLRGQKLQSVGGPSNNPGEQSASPTATSTVTKLNSTSYWEATVRATEEMPKNSFNSTMSFTVKPLKKKESDFLKSIGVEVEQKSQSAVAGNSDTKMSAKFQPDLEEKFVEINARKPLKSNGTKQTEIVDITNSAKLVPLASAKSSGVVSWNHLATTDVVFNRNRAVGEMDSKKKRKRASRDDMEYDAPQLKGLKKVSK
ncbi:hypothetical protein HDV01_006561 [Terramyces sp. JEL0728]|nr:hypothetical protein HDV01_006561 [Terramyces sp. JEL0728]